jgi:hypothetical protein
MEGKEMDCVPIQSVLLPTILTVKDLETFQFPFLNLKSALGPSMA